MADIHLELSDIKGESKDEDFKESIDLTSWDFNGFQASTAATGGGAGAGKVEFGNITVTKYFDKASTKLLETMSSGKPRKKGKLIQRKAGGEKLEFITLHMEDVYITSFQTGASEGQDQPIETVTMSFTRVGIVYQEQDESGAGKGGTVQFGYDTKANTEWSPPK